LSPASTDSTIEVAGIVAVTTASPAGAGPALVTRRPITSADSTPTLALWVAVIPRSEVLETTVIVRLAELFAVFGSGVGDVATAAKVRPVAGAPGTTVT